MASPRPGPPPITGAAPSRQPPPVRQRRHAGLQRRQHGVVPAILHLLPLAAIAADVEFVAGARHRHIEQAAVFGGLDILLRGLQRLHLPLPP